MKKMAPKVFLKSSLQDIIVQYVDYGHLYLFGDKLR